jgi:hypothetical protein
MRNDANTLAAEDLRLISSSLAVHRTPSGA